MRLITLKILKIVWKCYECETWLRKDGDEVDNFENLMMMEDTLIKKRLVTL